MISTGTVTTFQAGDRVVIDHPREIGHVFVVEAKLPKNYRVHREDNPAARVVVHPMLLRPAPPAGETTSSTPLGRPFEAIPVFTIGETVKLRGKGGVFVVTKTTPRGYSVALLGGDANRYWNAVPQQLTAVKITYEVVEA